MVIFVSGAVGISVPDKELDPTTILKLEINPLKQSVAYAPIWNPVSSIPFDCVPDQISPPST